MTPVEKNFRSGEFLFHEGDVSHALYLIKKGSVAIRKRKGSAYVELAKVHSGEVIGELAFFDRRPRSAAAVAIGDVEAFEISFESLDKLWAQIPEYMKTIMASVSERLRKANELIRKLQNETISADGRETPTEETLDAAAVLAATAGIGEPEKPTS